MKSVAVKLAAAALVASMSTVPALAQVAIAQVKPGMQVYDSGNHNIGAVAKLDANNVYVQTDKHVVAVNPASFALQNGKLFVGQTQAQLNASFEQSAQLAEASLQVGKPVKGLEGSVLGMIDEIDDQKVVVKLTTGQPIQLPRNGITGAASGAVVGVSAADLAKQLGTTSPAPAAPQAQ